ncbi:gfo/Idh/MocA family oxidoreductase [Roseomonas nepalensis]|uniref:Gfo/Idh/MocA family oxidoreductase n=1 Tax=Muricoccus nepalensis TaxID=1854500 RepID=A0A502GDU8_9PROT|nr:Gfo/Idh/MocA family oxidoreductase [Roseomonas nepalensis]TPG60467.1 gfo/Idh/MocA family oxidoreductase [Roseomonas nepalensis]
MKIALVGCGAIARSQHARALAGDTGFELVATVDPRATVPGFEGRHYTDHQAMLAAEPAVEAVSVASPTGTHFAVARDALLAGRHVMLEKPPATTLGEVVELQRLAAEKGRVLVTSFHAQHNAAVERAREILEGHPPPESITIEWREDFERWHGGQAWPWQPGGFGVFDPGINALSVLCHVMPAAEFRVERARLRLPPGAATPALVEMRLAWEGGAGDAAFEWRRGGEDVWNVTLNGAFGTLLIRGVRTLLQDGAVVVPEGPNLEYDGLYCAFRAAIAAGRSAVSLREMRIIEDALAVAAVEHGGEAL